MTQFLIIIIILKRLYEQAEEFMFALIAAWRSRPVRSRKAWDFNTYSGRTVLTWKLSTDIKFPPPLPPYSKIIRTIKGRISAVLVLNRV